MATNTEQIMQPQSVSGFKLRVLPWFTDRCSTFLSNLFKWLPAYLDRPLTALEFGAGNSTLYCLNKGLKIASVESDDSYIELILNLARGVGYKATVVAPTAFQKGLFSEFSLVIIKARSLDETDGILNKADWDIIISDGVSRRELLHEIHSRDLLTIVVLDNAEFCANWGRLGRGSAKPNLIAVYRAMLRDKNWRHYIFEQPEGREGRGFADKVGFESPHRWVTAVLWPDAHLLAKLMVSDIGFPLVNRLGVDDADTKTLAERCPFDWTEMKWLTPDFAPELDLKLHRDSE